MTSSISFNPPPGASGGVNGVPLSAGGALLNLVPANASGTLVGGVSTGSGAIFPTNGIWPTQNLYPAGVGTNTTFGRTPWTFTVDPTSYSNLSSNAQWGWLINQGWISPLN